MSYITQTDLETRWGTQRVRELTDRSRVGSADAALITEAIAAAADEIDPYLAARYSLPLSSTPGLVKRLAEVLAWAYLWRDQIDDANPVAALKRDAIETLGKIAKGTIALPIAGVTPTQTGGFAAASPSAVFDTTGVLDE